MKVSSNDLANLAVAHTSTYHQSQRAPNLAVSQTDATMSSFPSASNPIPNLLATLFQSIESSFPSATLGQDKWYILVLASLVSGNHPEQAAELYKYLILRPEFSSPDQRKALVRRLRECLLKIVIVVGVIKPIEAILCIAHVERPEDRDYSFSRENWSSGAENEKRGRAWLDAIYKHNHATTENILSCHKDFDWLSREITYGLFLSDHEILGPSSLASLCKIYLVKRVGTCEEQDESA
ncbi:hypothetical protein BST61_g3678 [Cercospora zeina]